MNGIDFLVIFLICIWVVLSGIHIYHRKKSGKCIGCFGCSGNCTACKKK